MQSKLASSISLLLLIVLFHSIKQTHAFFSVAKTKKAESTTKTTSTSLKAGLKPAATPLLASGKALAYSGESLIDLTSKIGLYGGGLSAAGASIRNAGDCIAQAAASCRFKTGMELVCDEMREGATCLFEAVDKGRRAMEEAKVDDNLALRQNIEALIPYLEASSKHLEEAGAGIMRREPIDEIGICLYECGVNLATSATKFETLAPEREEAKLCSQKMMVASDQMREAGNILRNIRKEKPKGKSWLKG